MRAERGAAASAFAALTSKGGSCSAISLPFAGPSTLAPPVKAGGGPSRQPVKAGEPAVQEKEHAWSDPLAQEFPPPPPESLPPRRGEGYCGIISKIKVLHLKVKVYMKNIAVFTL